MFEHSECDVHPSGSGIHDDQHQSTSLEILNEESIINELALISEEIASVEASINHNTGLKLKDPPDLNEILQTDESLITATSHNVGILNSACQLVLKGMEHQLLKLLKQNRNEQETVLNFLNSKGKIQDLESGKKNVSFKCVGIPYFKDMDGFFPPDNEDVLKKRKNNELLPVDFIDYAHSWTLTDTKNLIKAVKAQMNESQTEDCESIDWMKVSATGMDGKFSAIECRSKWLLHLKPGVNRSKWGLKETKLLEKIAEKYNYQDWDSISEELGTNRTSLQCCVKFQSQKTSNTGKWTKEEDEKLQNLIEKFKMKDHIPWAKVAWHFENRSLRQCQERYDYHLGKIKKGMFTLEEDFVLVYLATKLKNFGEVAKYLPNRASTQVRSRYEYLVKMSMPKFTKEEDKLLTKLMIQYPRNWAKISESFNNRSKLQCRRRWFELQKNIKLEEDILSDEEEELSLSANPSTSSDQKINQEISLSNLLKSSNVEVNKRYTGEYKKLLEYHNHCHKFLFGPKPKIPANSEESLKCLKFFRIISNVLSVGPVVPLESFNIESVMDNCEFDSEDMLLLENVNKVKDLAGGGQLNNRIIPPNFITLVGLRSLLLTRNKLGGLSKEYKPPQSNSCDDIDPESRLLFTDAKKLFKARMKALFTYPLILSNISQEGIEAKPVTKPKVRKGVKKMSKLRRKEHAKLMNQAFRRQKKLNEKLINAGDMEASEGEDVSEKQDTRKRKREGKMKAEREEEPQVKKMRRSKRETKD